MKDKKYGSMDKNVPGGWNGMIGELVRKVGDGSHFKLHYTYMVAHLLAD